MRKPLKLFIISVVVLGSLISTNGGSWARGVQEQEFGPVVRAYLGYLRNEQEVVDDRVSRREVSPVYYRRNSNRIRALRQMAIRIARESGNDYLPELEAVSRDELGLLFQQPPSPKALRTGEVLRNTFRFLGTIRSREVFYLFARLDPYEQSELMEKERRDNKRSKLPEDGQNTGSGTLIRTRRLTSP